MQVHLHYDMEHPPDCVWRLLSAFGDLSWNDNDLESVIVEGEGIGMTRSLYWANTPGKPTVQRLEHLDHKRRTIAYSIMKSPVRMFDDCMLKARIRDRGSKHCSVIVDIDVVDSEFARGDEIKAFLNIWVTDIIEMLDRYLLDCYQAARSELQPPPPAPA